MIKSIVVTSIAVSMLTLSFVSSAEVTVQCPLDAHVGTVLTVTARYAPDFDDPVAGGATAYMGANISEQFGSIAIFGPWFRSFNCNKYPCQKTVRVDQVPVDVANNSMIIVGVSILDAQRKEIDSATCQVRVLNP